MNPYEVLDISPGASPDEIKAAYHQMAKQWHPDRFTGDAKPEAERRFRLLAEAFNMLKDTVRREPSTVPAPTGVAAQPAAFATPTPAPEPPQSKTVDEWFQDAKAAMEGKAYDRSLGLIQYAIRLDGERAEFHALYGKVLDLTNGDKRMLVRTLETALRLNPKDLDSTVLLAQTFQGLGMHARASRLWGVVQNLNPKHPTLVAPSKPADAQGKAKPAGQGSVSDGSASGLVAELKATFNRLLKRG